MRRYRARDGRASRCTRAAAAAFSLVDAANEYIAETEPWTLARRGEQDRLTQVLCDEVEAVRIAALLLLPIMPGSAAEILRRMGETRAPRELRLDADAAWTAGGERTVIRSEPLWPRLEAAPAPAAAAAPGTEEKTMSDQPVAGQPMPVAGRDARRARGRRAAAPAAP